MGRITRIIDWELSRKIFLQIRQNVNWVDAIILICIGITGLFIIASIAGELFLQQLVYLCVAVALAIGLSFLDASIIAWVSPVSYVFVLLFLALSYTGPDIRGATRWIMIGGAQLQPSELVKPMLLLIFSWLMLKYPPRNLRNLPLHIISFLIPLLLVFKQPDLGTSIVYTVSWLAMMISGGFPLSVFALSVGFGSFFLPAGWQFLYDYQRARVLTFINPALDPRGAGYNALQSMIAVGSGQLIGRGLGRGTQSHLRFLPEFHTDFIFATLVEELGFIGGLLLLAGYAILLWRILSPLVNGSVDDLYTFLFSIGLFTMLLTQIIINTGMNMGIIPITGITLPLVSYGGSSLLSIGISFGLLWALRHGRKQPVSLH